MERICMEKENITELTHEEKNKQERNNKEDNKTEKNFLQSVQDNLNHRSIRLWGLPILAMAFMI